MKRVLFVLSLLFLLMSGCTQDDENITFTAVIESVSEQSIMVTTTDDVSFDKASVDISGISDPADFEAGQMVEITILPEIRESYPVQTTAVEIYLIDEEDIIPENTEPKKITAEEAKALIDCDDSVVILDVRTQEEYDEAHIENAVLLPQTEINEQAEILLPDKNTEILVYCKSGRRSKLASETLTEMGYTQVYDLGGLLDWPYETVN